MVVRSAAEPRERTFRETGRNQFTDRPPVRRTTRREPDTIAVTVDVATLADMIADMI